MNITLEPSDNSAIKAYSTHQINIGDTCYQTNLIVSTHEIVTDWAIQSINDINADHLKLLLKHKPDIVIIGHELNNIFAPGWFLQQLSQLRIGFESMSIGAASRTYNILLSEGRSATLGIIFPNVAAF